MDDLKQKSLIDNILDTESRFNKYTSLIRILNDEEKFVLDRDGFILSSNLDAVNVTGYDEYEIIGKHISIFYLPEEFEKVKADLDRALKLKNSIVTGLRVKKRGVKFWAKTKIKAIDSVRPSGPCFIVVLQDATHRVLFRERIRTIRDEYLTIFNNPFVGTFKFRMDGYAIQMCNQKTLEIIGKQGAINLSFENFFASPQQFELFISLLIKEKKLEGFRFLIQDEKMQQDNWAVISARYFETRGFVEGVLFDISEQTSQMLELKRVNLELDSFIYHASHDLRSPLTSIMGLINLGLKEPSTEVLHTYLSMIQDRIDHLDGLLKDLISVSYNIGDESNYHFFNFEDEVHLILKDLKSPDRLFQINVEVIQQCDFRTDSIRMRTILRNLLSNAFKYYNPAASTPFIHIAIYVDQAHCTITLMDNGIGIDTEFKDRVYEMFFRATERSKGSGLGLYIVKSMIERLNGSVSFESTLNVGTTFLLTIPNSVSQ